MNSIIARVDTDTPYNAPERLPECLGTQCGHLPTNGPKALRIDSRGAIPDVVKRHPDY